jgi:hypothetical protein
VPSNVWFDAIRDKKQQRQLRSCKRKLITSECNRIRWQDRVTAATHVKTPINTPIVYIGHDWTNTASNLLWVFSRRGR